MSATDDVVNTGVPLPQISEVRALSPFEIYIVWSAGSRAGKGDVIDLAPIICTYKIFRHLRKDEALFRTAHIIEDGDAVAWDGDDLELSAEAIESLAEQQMTPEEFSNFLKRNNLTQEGAAAILGYSRRQIASFTSTGPIPRVVALACIGYDANRFKNEIIPSIEHALKVSNDPERPLPKPTIKVA